MLKIHNTFKRKRFGVIFVIGAVSVLLLSQAPSAYAQQKQKPSLRDRINKKWDLKRFPVRVCPICGAGSWTLQGTGGTGGSGGGAGGGAGTGSTTTTIPPGAVGISTAAEFVQLLQGGNINLAGHYVLTADIDLSDSRNWNNGAGFLPIGDPQKPFTGTFDGGGHKITGLYINRPSLDNVGLFGYTNGAALKNIILENNTTIGNNNAGSLVGCNNNSSTITNSSTTGSVSGSTFVGGLVGYNLNSSTITNSFATGNVNGSGPYYAGGLVGDNAATIANSYAKGNVIGRSSVGGLAGGHESSSGRIINSYATGTVDASSGWEGGLVGYAPYGRIINSYATGAVGGGGGLVGYLGRASTTNCGWYDNAGDGATYGIGLLLFVNGPARPANVTYNETNLNAFYNSSHGVYDQGGANPWDFTNTWQANANGLPTLR